jgi:Orsellinic acid/F9775 biosynthesis cluster protein D
LYYKDFKLLLCNRCFSPVFPSFKAFKIHLYKDLSLIPLKEKKAIISQALLIFNTLEVSSYKENIELISLFIKHFDLPAFKELKVLDLYTCNFPNCFIILSNIRNIRRHFQESHKGSNIKSLYIVIKGHSLEPNRFFF